MPLSPTILGTCVLDGGAFSSIPSVLENWTRPLGRVAANESDRLQLPSIVVICKMLRHLIWWFRRQSREEKASAASELPSAMISSGVSQQDKQQELDLECWRSLGSQFNWILVAISDVMTDVRVDDAACRAPSATFFIAPRHRIRHDPTFPRHTGDRVHRRATPSSYIGVRTTTHNNTNESVYWTAG